MPKKDKGKKDKPDKNAKKVLKDFLKSKKAKNKTQAQWVAIIEALIPDAEDLDYEQIAGRLRGWMRGFPKGQLEN